MTEKIGIEISKDLKAKIFENCERREVSHVTSKMLEDFKNGKIEITFGSIPPANLCDSRLDMTVPDGLMDEVWKVNNNLLQRTNRWLITRLWQMRINGEI